MKAKPQCYHPKYAKYLTVNICRDNCERAKVCDLLQKMLHAQEILSDHENTTKFDERQEMAKITEGGE